MAYLVAALSACSSKKIFAASCSFSSSSDTALGSIIDGLLYLVLAVAPVTVLAFTVIQLGNVPATFIAWLKGYLVPVASPLARIADHLMSLSSRISCM